jgi:hypothetical protein
MLQEYLHKHPLTRHIYGREAVEKIRRHAFLAGNPVAKMSRSQKQNAYYWGVVLKTIGDDTGYLPEEMHQLMTREFLSYEKEPGEVFVRSTTSLNTKEFEDYLAKVRRFAATELSIFVALPNETEFSYEIPKVKK